MAVSRTHWAQRPIGSDYLYQKGVLVKRQAITLTAMEYLAAMPVDRVKGIHLAGYEQPFLSFRYPRRPGAIAFGRCIKEALERLSLPTDDSNGHHIPASMTPKRSPQKPRRSMPNSSPQSNYLSQSLVLCGDQPAADTARPCGSGPMLHCKRQPERKEGSPPKPGSVKGQAVLASTDFSRLFNGLVVIISFEGLTEAVSIMTYASVSPDLGDFTALEACRLIRTFTLARKPCPRSAMCPAWSALHRVFNAPDEKAFDMQALSKWQAEQWKLRVQLLDQCLLRRSIRSTGSGRPIQDGVTEFSARVDLDQGGANLSSWKMALKRRH